MHCCGSPMTMYGAQLSGVISSGEAKPGLRVRFPWRR